MRNFPLFKEANKTVRHQRSKPSNIRRKTTDKQKIVEIDRMKLQEILSVKQCERAARHFGRVPTFKKGCFNLALIKKQRKYFRGLKSRGSNPRYRRQTYKKTKQSKVILQKVEKVAVQRLRTKKPAKRSRSTPVEPKLYSVDKVKLRIASRMQHSLDVWRGDKHIRLVRFSDVEKQFGEIIDRIKKLKFAVDPN